MIDIKGLDKAEVLAALHNGTRALGMGALHDLGRSITVEECRADIEANEHFKKYLRFDYFHGRPLKVNLAGDEFNEAAYDRDAGHGAAARVIAALRERLVGAA